MSDFGLTKKTRNSDSLTSEFHSGCKNVIFEIAAFFFIDSKKLWVFFVFALADKFNKVKSLIMYDKRISAELFGVKPRNKYRTVLRQAFDGLSKALTWWTESQARLIDL